MKKENIYKLNTSKLWNNYNYVKKYNNFKYSDKDGNTYYMNSRRDEVLKYLEKLSQNNKTTILELGYGAGQNASYFIKKCKKYIGVDISLPLAKFAKIKNKRYVKSGKAKFLVGSMDKKLKIKSNSVDVIIIVGALQYVINTNYCLSECKRVLKKNGYLIIAQTNTFQINEMIHPRKFFINFSKFLIGEHHQYSHSDTIKSLLLETKLKKHFKKYKNSWWMNNWIFTYGWNDVWRFETNRRLLSYGRLKNILTKNKFMIKDSCGTPFFYNNKNIFSKSILTILDKILMIMNKTFIFSFFLKYISGSNIFLCQKRANF